MSKNIFEIETVTKTTNTNKQHHPKTLEISLFPEPIIHYFYQGDKL